MAQPSAGRLKVHRREIRLNRLEYSVLSPRPLESARFATNYFHETWHVITSRLGAQLLARLCWAMAFQRREHTVILIDSPLLVPSPFDADLPTPIVIVNNDLGALSRAAVKDLRAMLPLSDPSDGTVVLQTRGLDAALEDSSAFHERNREWNEHQKRRWIDGSSGLFVLAAPAPVLRMWGVDLANCGEHMYQGGDFDYLDFPNKTGEVQVLEEFDSMCTKAAAARSQVFPGKAERRLTEEERSKVWAALKRSGAEPVP